MIAHEVQQTVWISKYLLSAFFMENLLMILFVSWYCRRPDSMHNKESELNLVCPIVDLRWFFTPNRVEKDLSPSQFVTGKILTKILMFGNAVVKIPSLEFSKVEMFVTDLSDSEDKMSLNCKNTSRTDASRSLE